jgi:integrase
LNHHLGQFFIQGLSAKQLSKYRDLRLKDLSPESLKREMGVLRGMINHANREWEINLQQNPVSMVSLPKVGNGRDGRLEAGEEEKLLSATDELKQIIIIALETGMRRGEILNIKRSQIDFALQTLLIPLTKTDMPRTIPFLQRQQRRLESN